MYIFPPRRWQLSPVITMKLSFVIDICVSFSSTNSTLSCVLNSYVRVCKSSVFSDVEESWDTFSDPPN